MAKKKSVNKTELIRDAIAAKPEATPVEIAKQLSKHKVTPNYVSTVKSKMGKKKAKKVAKKKPASDKISLNDLVKASRLAEELGGVDKAQEMLNALAKLK